MGKLKPTRRKTVSVCIGKSKLGNDFPVTVQSMTNTNTLDTKASVAQAVRIIDAGAACVRFTAQGIKEAENLKNIKQRLLGLGYNTPLIADIHFNPEAAEIAAQYVEKVRINPGNYAKEEFLEKQFLQLLDICKKNKTAVRIGVNHGSLSERILYKYGDTPLGMVESCLEFLRICKKSEFHNVVVSVKSSNVPLMIKTNRLLVKKMKTENLCFPLHLGVTEAGEGEDGRIKSAVGIGTLLNEGIGDTIRVSLTEEPEKELPFAKKLIAHAQKNLDAPSVLIPDIQLPFKKTDFYKRETHSVQNIGASHVPVVIIKAKNKNMPEDALGYENDKKGIRSVDFVVSKEEIPNFHQLYRIIPFQHWKNRQNTFPLFTAGEFFKSDILNIDCGIIFVSCNYRDLTSDFLRKVKQNSNIVLVAQAISEHTYTEHQAFFYPLYEEKCNAPVILHKKLAGHELEEFQMKAAMDAGGLLADGLGNGIFIENEEPLSVKQIRETAFGILQAARVRTTKAEFISCPGCGRTLYDLMEVSRKVRKKLAHLHHLKIAMMGCIVNGPGEMGDADYGYVGGAPGKISLYKGQKMMQKNIPSAEAIAALIKLIKASNDWREPEDR